MKTIEMNNSKLPINGRMWKAKKGFVPFLVPILAFAGVVTLGYLAAKGLGWIGNDASGTTLQVVNNANVETDENGNQIVKLNNCGDTKTTSQDFVTMNPLDDDGTPTYNSIALKIQNLDGTGAPKTYTTDTDGTFAASSLGLNCGADYVVYVPAEKDNSTSLKMEFFTGRPTGDELLEVEDFDHITIKAYDNENHGDVYDSSDASAVDYEDLGSATATFMSTTNNATAYAMGVGSELDWTFKVKTASQKAWGDLVNYIVVDADKSDFKEPVLYFEGKALEEVGKGALKADDQGYLSAYEYVFALPQDITENTDDVRIKAASKSSINPDVDIVLRFVAESYWIDGVDVKQSIFNTAGVEVLSSKAQTITIDVS